VAAWACALLIDASKPSAETARTARWHPWIGMAGMLLVFLGFYVIKHAYYGVWISHAFAMKEIATYYKPAPLDLARHWLLFVSVPAALSCWSLKDRRLWPAWVYLLLSFGSVLLGPRSDWSRYSAHLVPLVYALGSVGLTRLLADSAGRPATRLVMARALMLVMLAQAGTAAAFNWRNMTQLADHQVCRRALGEHIRTQISPGEPIASSDLGVMSYVAIEHEFVDLVALTSADVLASYKRGESADQILTDKHVRYIADTVSPKFDDRVNELLAQFPQVHEVSRYAVSTTPAGTQAPNGNAIGFGCESRGVSFRLAELSNAGQYAVSKVER